MSIFNYYVNYFNEEDISEIKEAMIKNLKNLDNNLNFDKNYYLEDILVLIVYYLVNNQILSFSDFNAFNREYNNIKKEMIKVLDKVVKYKYDKKNYLTSELKKCKFYNENKKMLE